jgi:hypothetical protein
VDSCGTWTPNNELSKPTGFRGSTCDSTGHKKSELKKSEHMVRRRYVGTRISKIPVLVRALPVLERVPVLIQAFFSMPVLVAGRFLRYPYAQSARSRTSTTQFVPVLVRSPASSRTGISLCPY